MEEIYPNCNARITTLFTSKEEQLHSGWLRIQDQKLKVFGVLGGLQIKTMLSSALSLVKDFFPFPDIGQRARKEMNAVSISIVTVANLYFYFLTVVGSSRSIIGQSLFFTFPVIGQGLEKKWLRY